MNNGLINLIMLIGVGKMKMQALGFFVSCKTIFNAKKDVIKMYIAA